MTLIKFNNFNLEHKNHVLSYHTIRNGMSAEIINFVSITVFQLSDLKNTIKICIFTSNTKKWLFVTYFIITETQYSKIITYLHYQNKINTKQTSLVIKFPVYEFPTLSAKCVPFWKTVEICITQGIFSLKFYPKNWFYN